MKNKAHRHSLAGVALCVLIFAIPFLLNANGAVYFNLIGLAIVVSGTCGAALLSYPFESLKNSLLVAEKSYSENPATGDDVINALLFFSLKAKNQGVLSLENDEKKERFSFLKNALGLMVDGFKEEDLRSILTKEVMFFKERRLQHERTFRHLATIAPAFGLIGSVVGLIDMLTGIGEPGVIIKTIPVALTSTLYGIVLSNFFFTPMAENIRAKTQDELLAKKIVIEGVAAIMNEHNNPRVLKKKLESFLTPAQRTAKIHPFRDIVKRYHDQYDTPWLEKRKSA